MSQLKKVYFKLSLVKSGKNAYAVWYAVKRYRKINRDRLLKKGYKEMALLNHSLAEMCLESDNDSLQTCEEKLTECE